MRKPDGSCGFYETARHGGQAHLLWWRSICALESARLGAAQPRKLDWHPRVVAADREPSAQGTRHHTGWLRMVLAPLPGEYVGVACGVLRDDGFQHRSRAVPRSTSKSFVFWMIFRLHPFRWEVQSRSSKSTSRNAHHALEVFVGASCPHPCSRSSIDHSNLTSSCHAHRSRPAVVRR